MKPLCYAIIISILMLSTGCGVGGKYINPRGELDRSLYYVEREGKTGSYPISSNFSRYSSNGYQVTQVPQPALVDQNSTIEIVVAKDHLRKNSAAEVFSKQSDELLKRKATITSALGILEEVVKARRKTIETYQQKDLPGFYEAKKNAAKVERALLSKLMGLWPNSSKEYSSLENAYDRPTYAKLQQFLRSQIVEIESANRAIEKELKSRARTLSLEAFLYSSGKEPVAVHLDGYDSLKEGKLERRDNFGLNLSKEEQEQLNAHLKSTEEMAAALERLRRGEASLNEAVKQVQSLILPQLSDLVSEAERLQSKLDPEKLKERKEKTEALIDAYLQMIKEKNKELYDKIKDDFKRDQSEFLSNLPKEADEFFKAAGVLIKQVKSLQQNFEKATPDQMIALIYKASEVANSFEALRKRLPTVASDVSRKAQEYLDRYANNLKQEEQDMLLKSEEAQVLRTDLEGYFRDCRDAAGLVTKTADALSELGVHQIAEIPSTTTSFQVPVESIKSTFLDLQTTPRLVGDVLLLKATLKEGESIIDTSVAKFEMERFGHFAEFSPAVILVKPTELKGGDDGFRFAPVVSWMHHWSPRPENTGTAASLFRALDPAIGIHSAFTNFRSDNSKDTVQIGLGATVSVWKNRLQFGAGYNLMAESKDSGQYYLFVGSDLIGILQTIGIAK